jgi:hypothetical protein
VPLKDAWARRQLLIGVRDPDEMTRHVRAMVEHLCKT